METTWRLLVALSHSRSECKGPWRNHWRWQKVSYCYQSIWWQGHSPFLPCTVLPAYMLSGLSAKSPDENCISSRSACLHALPFPFQSPLSSTPCILVKWGCAPLSSPETAGWWHLGCIAGKGQGYWSPNNELSEANSSGVCLSEAMVERNWCVLMLRLEKFVAIASSFVDKFSS